MRPRAVAATDTDSDDEETHRVEYLRHHRAMLEQKRRLETERRVSELEADKASITKRQHSLIAASEKATKEAAESKRKLGVSASLPSLAVAKQAVDAAVYVGMYAKPDDMSLDVLRVIAERQALHDMEPLNTRGKYHARYIKDAYPIAGSQLKLEKERDLVLAAKKRILLAKTERSVPGPADENKRGQNRIARGFGQFSYRKLDFCVDKFSTVLQHEKVDLDLADEQRRVRLACVQHREGLDQFWRLLHGERYHETLAWLKTHRFRDVNVPVVLHHDRDEAAQHTVVVEENKYVGVAPLMAACCLHHVALVRALLDQGAVVYLTTANGDTAMHFLFRDWRDQQALTTLRRTTETLVRADHTLQILQMLVVQQGADVNTQNAFGETALQHCARLGLVQCVELLLSHGGDSTSQDRSGGSALSYARANNHDSIVRLLETNAIVERTIARERARSQSEAKLRQKRGTLTADWSESPDKLLARLAVEDRRAGHLRHQYVDRRGNVIVCKDDTDD